MFDRLTGANVLFDEMEVPRALWSTAPRHVSIALTNACDLCCSYCYAPKKRAELKLDVVKGWLHELDANGTLGVGFGGGEPTLYPQFLELCNYATANTRLAISFTTHGHHLNDMLLMRLKGNIHFVRVSVDGLNATYERLRRRPFSIIKQRIIALRGVVPFGINYVINDDTLPDLENMIDFASDMGASEFLLLPEYEVGAGSGARARTLDALRAILRRYNGSLPLRISELSSEGMPVCDPFNSETGLLSYAHVDAEGILKRTSYENFGLKITADGFMNALMELAQQENNIYS